ncbi:hypothetical protein [Brachybacterium phenoliresistens]|uniref:hypothetical protein n=1 Tax=Brachybacterium phenoliresistens TaxID=396014 RepID=UPI0031CE02E2
MSALRFAVRVALAGDVRHRWRQGSVVVCSLLATVAGLLWIALPVMASEAYVRGAARAAMPSEHLEGMPDGTAPPDATALIAERATIVGGAQVSTVWIQPVPGHEDDPGATPVGMTRLPAPGEAVLSPGLVDAGHTAEDLGWVSSEAGSGVGGVLGDEALMSRSEQLIFVRPRAGQELPARAGWYIAGFGDAGDPQYPAFVTDPDVLSPGGYLARGLFILVVPALVLLVSGARARSAVRDHRLRFMTTLGIRASVSRLVLGAETAVLAAIGAVLGAAVFAVLSSVVTTVPVVELVVARGALRPPAWAYIVVAVSVVAIAGLAGAMGRLSPPTVRRPRRVLAIGASIGVLGSLGVVVLSSLQRGDASASPSMAAVQLLFAGALGTIVLLPVAMPALVELPARILRRSRRPAVWAAARRIVVEARGLSRIPAVLSVLIVVVSVASASWVASGALDTAVSGPGSTRQAQASWYAPQPDIAPAAEAVASLQPGAMVLQQYAMDDSDGPSVDAVAVEDCPSVVRLLGEDPDAFCQDSPALGELVRARTGLDVIEDPASDPRVIPDREETSVLILSPVDLDLSELQRELGWHTAFSMGQRPGDVRAALPIQRWVLAGIFATLALLLVAVTREVGDRSIEDAQRDRHYLRLGLGARDADRIGWWTLLIPVATSVVVSMGASTLIAYGGEPLEATKGSPAQLVTIAVAALVLTLAAIAVTLPVRRAMRGVR